MAGGFVKLVSQGRTNQSAKSPPGSAFGSQCQRAIDLLLRPQMDAARAESSVLYCAEDMSSMHVSFSSPIQPRWRPANHAFGKLPEIVH